MHKDKLGKDLVDGCSVVSHYLGSLIIGQVLKSTNKRIKIRIYTKAKRSRYKRIPNPDDVWGWKYVREFVPYDIFKEPNDVIVIDDPDVVFYALQNS